MFTVGSIGYYIYTHLILLFGYKVYEVVYCRLGSYYEVDDGIQRQIAVQSTDSINVSFNSNISTNKYRDLNRTIGSRFYNKESMVISPIGIPFPSHYDDQINTSFIPIWDNLYRIRNLGDIKKISFETEKSSPDCTTTPLIDRFIDISHLLLAINSSANVIIYMLRGK